MGSQNEYRHEAGAELETLGIADAENSDDVQGEHKAAKSTELSFAGHLTGRPEIGFTRMLSNLALEPPDPFKPEAQRTFRKGFIIAVLVSALFAEWFVWFNVIR